MTELHAENVYHAPKAALADGGDAEFADVGFWRLNGRMGRTYYLAYGVVVPWVAYFVVSTILSLLSMVFLAKSSGVGVVLMVIGSLVSMGVFLGLVCVASAKRLHDINTTGWLSLLFLVPVVNLIAFPVLGLVLLFAPGAGTSNTHGPRPVPAPVLVKILGFGGVFFVVLIAVVGFAIAIPQYEKYLERAHAAEKRVLQNEAQGVSLDPPVASEPASAQ